MATLTEKFSNLVDTSGKLNKNTEDLYKLKAQLLRLNNDDYSAEILEQEYNFQKSLLEIEEKRAQAKEDNNSKSLELLQQEQDLIEELNKKQLDNINEKHKKEIEAEEEKHNKTIQDIADETNRMQINLLRTQGNEEEANALEQELSFSKQIAAINEKIAKEKNESLIDQYNKQKEILTLIQEEKQKASEKQKESTTTKSTTTTTDEMTKYSSISKQLIYELLGGQIIQSQYRELQDSLTSSLKEGAMTPWKNPDKTYQLNLTSGNEKLTAITDVDPAKFLEALEEAKRKSIVYRPGTPIGAPVK